MDLANMPVDEVEAFEIPTATPIIFYFDDQGLPLQWHYLAKPGRQAA
jgi:bisphosphoglycerate-dependent phosphoglycerate mutase